MGQVHAHGLNITTYHGFDGDVALDDFDTVVRPVLQAGISQHLGWPKLLRGGTDFAKGDLLALEVRQRLDRPFGHYNDLCEVVGPLPANHGLCVGELGEYDILGRPGEHEVNLVGAHGLNGCGAIVDRRELDLDTG